MKYAAADQPRRPDLGRVARRLLPRVVIGLVAPIVVYALVRGRAGSDADALVIAGILPAAWTAVQFVWHRRIDPIGAISAVSFGLAVFISAATGGNRFLLEVRDATVVGLVGLIALGSVAIRRPLLATLLRLIGRPVPPNSPRVALATAIVGATLTIHATVPVTLALMLPTATFLALNREVGLAILAGGFVLLLLIRGGPATAA